MATNGNAPTVVIVGAGAAGIFTAYQINKLWPGQFNIRLFESSPEIGGNVSSRGLYYGGLKYIIDCGAQFFTAKAQPQYMQLIQDLGLQDQTPSYPAGITIWDSSTNQRLLWIPSLLSGFLRYTLDDWERLVEFGLFLVAAVLLNVVKPYDWTKSVDTWLAEMPLSDDFKQNVITNFLYQFVSLPYASIGQASALYATTYFVRNVFGKGATPMVDDDPAVFETNQCLIGLLGILEAALQASGVSAETNSSVSAVAPSDSGITVTANGNQINAQYVVMACDPGNAANILAAGGTANGELIGDLHTLGNQYLPLSIIMQKDGSCWMPDDKSYWEAVNTVVDSSTQAVTFNAWFGPLRPRYDTDKRIPVYKSWGAPNLSTDYCSHWFDPHVHNVMLPYTSFITTRDNVDKYQGHKGLWFAGGWTHWFDSQEAALTSAMRAATAMQPPGMAEPASQPTIEYDTSKIPGQVKSWIEMVLPYAPDTHKSRLIDLIKQLPE